jgi:ubiquinone/menaquinone biosynthesis C-methylase UbiE
VSGSSSGVLLAHRAEWPPRSSFARGVGSLYDFDSVAQSYDEWYRRPVGRMYDRLEKKAIANVLPSPASGDRLLEIGCGTGHWSAFFARQGFRVMGLDISAPMLAMARGRRIPRAEFCRADAGTVPFAGSEFDVAAAITVLEFVPEPRKLMEEMVRCVRSGGRIVVGALNRWSYSGLSRKLRGKPLFRDARFFSRRELRELLSEYGNVKVRSAACFFPWRWALRLAPALDRAACALGLPFGDFLAGEVRL